MSSAVRAVVVIDSEVAGNRHHAGCIVNAHEISRVLDRRRADVLVLEDDVPTHR